MGQGGGQEVEGAGMSPGGFNLQLLYLLAG